MSALREALLSALNAHGEATLDNGARVRVLPEAVLRDVLALHDSPVASRKGYNALADWLAEVFSVDAEGSITWEDAAKALFACGAVRDEVTVKAEALEQAARRIIVPGASSRAAEWLEVQAAQIRNGGQS